MVMETIHDHGRLHTPHGIMEIGPFHEVIKIEVRKVCVSEETSGPAMWLQRTRTTATGPCYRDATRSGRA
jgi:hypothetical protein